MGAVARGRHEPGWRPVAAVARALAVLLAGGCGAAVSLDAAPADADASTSVATTTSGEPGSSSTEATAPDLPLPDVPAPPTGACPAGCAVELPLVWAWDEDPPHGVTDRRLVAVARAPDGTLVLAEVRDGESWLTGVDRDGVLLWSRRVTIECSNCEVTGVTLDPGGALLVLFEGPPYPVRPVMVYAYALGSTGPAEIWSLWDLVRGTPERSGRAGAMVSLGFAELVLPVIEVGLDPEKPDQEWIALRYYLGGESQGVDVVDSQLAGDPRWRPRAAALPDEQLALAIPGPATGGDYVVPVDHGLVGATLSAPGPIEAMAASPAGTLVTVGGRRRSPAEMEVVELHVTALDPTGPLPWQWTEDVITTSHDPPLLALDALGIATVALRTTAGPPDDPDETAVALWRIAADGTLQWSTSLPLPAGRSPAPLGLALADDDHDLVLAALVDGRLHLERREPGCPCD